MNGTDFVTKYLEHTSGGETPMVFHRWSCITGISALLEKNVFLHDGLGNTYPNMYTMLVGGSGTRKSTAIKTMVKYLKKAGYANTASDSATKEAFLHFMANSSTTIAANGIGADPGKILFQDINAPSEVTTPTLIAADEFNNFFSNNVIEFLSMLGELWDYEGNYTGIARSGNVNISNPCVTMLTGNTTETLCRNFPIEALGQGFFSRQLFIHGEPNGVKIAFPEPPNEKEVEAIVDELRSLTTVCNGRIDFTPSAKKLAALMYETHLGNGDPRFTSYENRRFTHLKKLCIIHAIADKSPVIEEIHVIRANTVLSVAEFSMPKALGEYGISRNSRVMHKIVSLVEAAIEPYTHATLLAAVRHDLEKMTDFFPIVNALAGSKRIMETEAGHILPIRSTLKRNKEDPFIDWDYMSPEELK